MSKHIPTGIAANSFRFRGTTFDKRTTAEVEESRNMTNRKPSAKAKTVVLQSEPRMQDAAE